MPALSHVRQRNATGIGCSAGERGGALRRASDCRLTRASIGLFERLRPRFAAIRRPMPLVLYNTLTRRKEVFEPLDPKNVRMYVCGPTVYDFAHIGNARPVIVFDVLYRLLRHSYGAAHVRYVRNITDIDDKINAAAKANGESIRSVTERTAKAFHEDVAA